MTEIQVIKRTLAVLVIVMLVCQQGFATVVALPQDNGWPRQIVNDGGTLIYYQPQIDSWSNYKELTGRAAFSLTPKSGKATVGVVSFHA